MTGATGQRGKAEPVRIKAEFSRDLPEGRPRAFGQHHQTARQHAEMRRIAPLPPQHFEDRHHPQLGRAIGGLGPGRQLACANVIGQDHHPQALAQHRMFGAGDGEDRIQLGKARGHQFEDRTGLQQPHPPAFDQPVAMEAGAQLLHPPGIKREAGGVAGEQPVQQPLHPEQGGRRHIARPDAE